jgi:hypothetical protein
MSKRDIVWRLRAVNDELLAFGNDYSDLLLDAANEIERLRSVEEQRDELKAKWLEVPDEYADMGEFVVALNEMLFEAHESFGQVIDERDELKAKLEGTEISIAGRKYFCPQDIHGTMQISDTGETDSLWCPFCEIDKLKARLAQPDSIETHCPECGPGTELDEDLCCSGCGSEATLDGLVNRVHELEARLAPLESKRSSDRCNQCGEGMSLEQYCWHCVTAMRTEIDEYEQERIRMEARLAQLDRSLTLDNGTVVRVGDVLVCQNDRDWNGEHIVKVTCISIAALVGKDLWEMDTDARGQSMKLNWRPWSEVYPDRPVPGENENE